MEKFTETHHNDYLSARLERLGKGGLVVFDEAKGKVGLLSKKGLEIIVID